MYLGWNLVGCLLTLVYGSVLTLILVLPFQNLGLVAKSKVFLNTVDHQGRIQGGDGDVAPDWTNKNSGISSPTWCLDTPLVSIDFIEMCTFIFYRAKSSKRKGLDL